MSLHYQSTGGLQGTLKAHNGLSITNGRLNVDNGAGLAFDGSNKLKNEWYTVQADSDVDLGSNRIKNLGNPTENSDVANKSYVDDITGNVMGSKLHPLGIPDDIISTHFDGEISENVTTSNGWVTKIWDATGKGHDYTATEAMKYTYNSNQKRLEMTSTSGQRMKGTLPSGASDSTQPYSWTMVAELSEPDSSKWSDSNASILFNLFNSDNGSGVRFNALYGGDNLKIIASQLTADSSNFWDHEKYQYKAPLRIIITGNYNSNDDATDVYINSRWFGQNPVDRNTNEVVIGNGDDVAPHNFPHFGYVYECFYTNDSLTETQIGNIHDYLNEKWDVYQKPLVDIFTMAGQSNMVGRGDSSKSPHPAFGFFLDPQYWNSSRTRMNTIVDPVGTADTLNQATSGSAIPAFCQEYFNQTGRIPVILHVADGGTSIFEDTEWNPDADQDNYTDDVINILNSAETHLNDLGWDIGKKSVLWHQGENDAGTAVQTYKDKFLSLVDKFLDNGYDYFFYYEISERDTDDHDKVREAQRLAHQERDNLYMIFSCANFHAQNLMSDGVHYNQEGYNLMGRQGAKSIANNVINNLQNKWYLQKARTDVNMADHKLTHLKTGQSASSSVNKGYVDTMSSKPQLLRACKSYYDFESDYDDRVGQNDGTNNGTSLTTGKIGQAVDVTAQNTVELGDALDVQDGDFSVSFWYYGRSYGGGTDNNFLVWNENRSGGQSPRWGLLHREDDNIIQIFIDDGSLTRVDGSVLELHKWYFITAMRRGTTGYLYVNGVKDAESTIGGGIISTAGESRIGRNSVNGDQTSDFIIDELSVWDRVLSGDEISYLYNQGAGRNDFATFDHHYPKAQSNLDMNQNRILQVAGSQTEYINLGDDSVYHYTPTNVLGNLAVSVNGDVAHILFNVSAPLINLSSQIQSEIVVNTGVASGTTGTDGKFTVFADGTNNRITFENRLGQAEDVRFLHLL